MKITMQGAAGGQVTGSAYQIQTRQANVLVDFGVFQGVPNAEERNQVPAGLDVSALDAVLVTHAHLDHTGRLPLLAKHGYAGSVYATPATIELTDLILRDSAKIQAQDTERLNRKRERAGKPAVEPLFGVGEVERVMAQFRAVGYGVGVAVAPGVTARFVEAGHLLGSASIEVTVEEEGRRKVVVFSGDLGPKGAPILRDAEPFQQADLVFLESTYGDHDHKPFEETVAEFFGIVGEAARRGGKMLVPTFAVGRAQLMMVLLAWAFRQGRFPAFPIYLDSPMAIEATAIYRRHPELFDDEMVAMMKERPIEADLALLRATPTADESKALNDRPGPCLILAGAGMCTAGRILHHLKQNLWRPETSVLMVGYQGEGSLGRLLVDGAKRVSILGEEVAVRARVHTLSGFSAHAGQRDLLGWLGAMAGSRPRVVLTHGEDRARRPLGQAIEQRYGCRVEMPRLGETLGV